VQRKVISLRSTLTAINQNFENISFRIYTHFFLWRGNGPLISSFFKKKCYFHDYVETDLSLFDPHLWRGVISMGSSL
jgi:hypothetical protein